MRGHDEQTTHMFSEQRVPADHPLRAVRALTDGPADVAPIRDVRHDRASVDPTGAIAARFVCRCSTRCGASGCSWKSSTTTCCASSPVWHPTTFTKNRDRLVVAAAFFDAVQAHARAAGLLSDHGTQLEAGQDAAESDPPEDPGNRSTSTGSGGAMTPISRRPIPRRCCIGRAKARKPSWRISATCCWTLSPTSGPTRRGPPNATRR